MSPVYWDFTLQPLIFCARQVVNNAFATGARRRFVHGAPHSIGRIVRHVRASSVDHLVKNQTLSVADTARTRCVARAGWLGIAIDSILTSIHRRSDTSWSRTARPGKIQTHSP